MSRLRGGIVYRALIVAALATTVALAQFGARRQRATPSTGPRALAVVIPVSSQTARPAEKSAASKDQYIVLPVTLFYQGRYYDGATYKANPAPMALWAETVYEVQRSGEPVGTISIDTDTTTAGGWQGHGELRLKGAEPERKASAANGSPAATTDEPPRLRRSGATPTSNAPSQAPSQSTSASTQPPSSGASQPAAAPSTTGSAPAPSTQPSVRENASGPQNDESRPRLQRGKPAEAPAAPAARTPSKSPAPATSSAAAPTATPSAAQPAMLAAISDASTTESHSFALNWSPAEIERLTSAARKLASDTAAKYAAQRFPSAVPAKQRTPPMPRPRTRTTPGTARVQLEDVKLKFFDVDFDNNPEIVLTARESLPVPGGGTRTLYLALAARDEQGSALYPLLSYVTDDQRLDAVPRLEFIDAVDADGDGIAELLFRSIGTADESGNLSRGFQLYHTGPDRLRKVFDSSGSAD